MSQPATARALRQIDLRGNSVRLTILLWVSLDLIIQHLLGSRQLRQQQAINREAIEQQLEIRNRWRVDGAEKITQSSS